jgi:hypothetical protein
MLTAMLSTQPAGNQPRTSRPTPVPAGGGDTDTLSRGLANDTSSIDDGVGFGKVYELPRQRGQPRRFARINGAMIAVFPLSAYVSTKDGEVATVPGGTTYYIGADWIRRLTTPVHADEAPGLLAAPTAVDLSTSGAVQTRTNTRPSTAERAGEPEAAAPRSIWTDETYRRERIAHLLRP